MRGIVEALHQLVRERKDGALATVVNTKGSTPQCVGAKLLLQEDGQVVGTVGGGAFEAAVLEALRACLQSGASGLRKWDLIADLGMCCGGHMEVFIESISSRPRLLLFGAGHVHAALAPMAQMVGFDVFVVDERIEFNNEERFVNCERLHLDPKAALDELEPNDRDWLTIATHDHRLDEEALRTAIVRPHRYIGMIGSKRKSIRILARVAERLPNSLPLTNVYSPIGLAIGAITPEEIAISVLAELISVRRGTTNQSHMRISDDARLQEMFAKGELAEAIVESEIASEQSNEQHQ